MPAVYVTARSVDPAGVVTRWFELADANQSSTPPGTSAMPQRRSTRLAASSSAADQYSVSSSAVSAPISVAIGYHVVASQLVKSFAPVTSLPGSGDALLLESGAPRIDVGLEVGLDEDELEVNEDALEEFGQHFSQESIEAGQPTSIPEALNMPLDLMTEVVEEMGFGKE